MKSPELLEATASEPLSLQEEYEMQGEHLIDTINISISPSSLASPYTTFFLEKWHVDDDSMFNLPLPITIICELICLTNSSPRIDFYRPLEIHRC
jgi:hypothetical protein